MTARRFLPLLLACFACCCVSCSAPRQETFTSDDELAALSTLQQPANVQDSLWQELKDGLRRELLLQPQRTTSAPPLKPSSSAPLEWDSATATLTWSYTNVGDYDQNSEVNIADLTPIAVNFHESVAPDPFPSDSVEFMVDGDGNGEINISDLSPIGGNLHASVRGYNIYASPSDLDYPSSPGEASVIEPIGSVTFEDHLGVSNQQRLTFTFTVDFPFDGDYYWVRPTDGVSEGVASNIVQDGGGGGGPVTAVSVYPCPSGQDFHQVTFHAVAEPSDGNLTFDWDFTNDGSVDDSSASDTATFTYPADGTYTIKVHVSDDIGGSAENTGEVTLPYLWSVTSFTYPGSTSLGYVAGNIAVVDGNPAFAAVGWPSAAPPRGLWFYRATDPQGTAWSGPTEVVPEGVNSGGSRPFLFAMPGTKPALLLGGDQNSFNWCYNAMDQSGLSWSNGTQVNQAFAFGGAAYIGGLPSIAYQGFSTAMFVQANQDATTWGGPTTLPITLDDNQDGIELFELQGKPCLGIRRLTDESTAEANLSILPALATDGSSWGAEIPVFDGHPQAVRWEIISGRPACLFMEHNATSYEFRYLRAGDDAGTIWGTPQTIAAATTSDSLSPVSDFIEFNGVPVVLASGYYFGEEDIFVAEQSLHLFTAADADGTTWSPAEPIGCGSVLAGGDLSVANGKLFVNWGTAPFGYGPTFYIGVRNGP